MRKINNKFERAADFNKRHKVEIESSKENDGFYYIFKQLYNALAENTNVIGLSTKLMLDNNQEQNQKCFDYLESCRDYIITALCELIDADYVNQIQYYEKEIKKLKYDRDSWKGSYNGKWDKI